MMIHHSTIPYQPHEPIKQLTFFCCRGAGSLDPQWTWQHHPDLGTAYRGATSSALHCTWHGRSGNEQKAFPECEDWISLEKIGRNFLIEFDQNNVKFNNQRIFHSCLSSNLHVWSLLLWQMSKRIYHLYLSSPQLPDFQDKSVDKIIKNPKEMKVYKCFCTLFSLKSGKIHFATLLKLLYWAFKLWKCEHHSALA